MAQQKAPSHTALSLAAESHPVSDDNCIFVNAEEAWIQYSVARRALLFHLKEYLRSVDTEVATRLDTSGTSIDIRRSYEFLVRIRPEQPNSSSLRAGESWDLIPASDANYWQTKVARDSVIKDCNDVLFWMEMIKLQEGTGGKMWNTAAAAGSVQSQTVLEL
ncbi:hypothetical protein CcaCcLH18_12493 [Colletotrichum camelliae]|nr:hypothetical protein CcaCcLH18_12493 [Colletotrichum camelliae]